MRLLQHPRDGSHVRDGSRLGTPREPRRLSALESVDNGQPAFSRCGDSQERRERSAESAAPCEHVEPRGTARVRGLSQQPSSDQCLERLHDLREVIPDIFGQAVVLQVGLRMAVEKQEQIEIARGLGVPGLGELDL
jgi:hypothetical protein